MTGTVVAVFVDDSVAYISDEERWILSNPNCSGVINFNLL